MKNLKEKQADVFINAQSLSDFRRDFKSKIFNGYLENRNWTCRYLYIGKNKEKNREIE